RQPFPYGWNEGHGSRVGVFRRDGDGTDLRWFEVSPCYVYHPMNAFDDGDRVVVDVVRHPSTMRTDVNGPFEGNPVLERWTIDLARGGAVAEQRLDDHPLEFPRVDERLTGHRHRIGYAPVNTDPDATEPVFDAVMRIDTETQQATVRSFGPGQFAHEFVFVP